MSRNTVGLFIQDYFSISDFSAGNLLRENASDCTHATRHINADHILGNRNTLKDETLDGSYKIGTLEEYGSNIANIQDSRLNDRLEGKTTTIVDSQLNQYYGKIGSHRISQLKIVGAESPIKHEVIMNEYCTCLSKGTYNKQRAESLISSGNDINYYFVYDLKKLINAIKNELENNKFYFDTYIYRLIKYDKAVIKLNNEELNIPIKNNIETWNSTIFTKSSNFKLEEEVRLIPTNRSQLGKLPKNSKPIILKSDEIKNSIIDHGKI